LKWGCPANKVGASQGKNLARNNAWRPVDPERRVVEPKQASPNVELNLLIPRATKIGRGGGEAGG